MRIIPGRKKCRATDAAADVTTGAARAEVQAAAVGGRVHKAAEIAVRAVAARGVMIAADRGGVRAEGNVVTTIAVAVLVEIAAGDLVVINANNARNCRRLTRRSCRAAKWWIPWPSRSG